MAKTNGTKTVKTVEKTPDLGISRNQQQDVATILKIVLADEAIVYQKLRNYHWNVTGPHFFELHIALETLLTRLPDLRVLNLHELHWRHHNTLRGVEALWCEHPGPAATRAAV